MNVNTKEFLTAVTNASVLVPNAEIRRLPILGNLVVTNEGVHATSISTEYQHTLEGLDCVLSPVLVSTTKLLGVLKEYKKQPTVSIEYASGVLKAEGQVVNASSRVEEYTALRGQQGSKRVGKDSELVGFFEHVSAVKRSTGDSKRRLHVVNVVVNAEELVLYATDGKQLSRRHVAGKCNLPSLSINRCDADVIAKLKGFDGTTILRLFSEREYVTSSYLSKIGFLEAKAGNRLVRVAVWESTDLPFDKIVKRVINESNTEFRVERDELIWVLKLESGEVVKLNVSEDGILYCAGKKISYASYKYPSAEVGVSKKSLAEAAKSLAKGLLYLLLNNQSEVVLCDSHADNKNIEVIVTVKV